MKLIELTNGQAQATIQGLERLGATNVKIYNMDTGSTVIYNIENGKEHVSISNRRRLPTWEELKYVRYTLMKPTATVVQILPPKSEYVNIHENCFHLWELNSNEL